MATFDGYYRGWDRCKGCGLRLVRVGESLRHRRGDLKRHDLVARKRLEAAFQGYVQGSHR